MSRQSDNTKPEITTPTSLKEQPDHKRKVFILQLALVLSTVSAYILAFFLLYNLIHSGMTAALAIVPVVIAAWSWGLRGGLFVALLCSVVNGLLRFLVPPSAEWHLVIRDLVMSVIVYLPLGGGIGHLRELGNRLQQEVAERKRMVAMLQEERKKTQKYFDVVEVIIIAIDVEQKVTFVNRKGCEILGYAAEDIIGKSWFDHFVPTEMKEEVSAVFAKLVAGEIEAVEYFENPVLTKSGIERHIAWHNGILRNETGQIMAIVSSGEDVTELRQEEKRRADLEERLRHSQKVEAIGRLAGGIAHDFNNLLTGIMGYSEMALQVLPADEPARLEIQGIQRIVQRAATLTRQLLTFARQQIITPEVLNLNDMILNIDKMLRRLIGEDIELVTILDPALGQVKVDPGQLEQVLLNLVINARDAMPKGGRLIIKSANISLDEDDARQYDNGEVRAGEYVLLTVSDTGIGMTPEVKARLFEPFFTTKEVGKGTGLGLAIVYGIVKQSDGHIRVDSEPDRGTTFQIYLPRVKEAIRPVTQANGSNDLPRGNETILLAEDEVTIRESATRHLRQLGYTVWETANGQEALQLAETQVKQKIDLLVTDIVMPQMGGTELAEQLKLMRPDLKVLYLSGHTNSAIIRHGLPKPGSGSFISKPFSLNSLAGKVRAVLDGIDRD